jgi:hypothetical protein
VLKAMSNCIEALSVARDALLVVKMTSDIKVNFLMEIILLSVQLHRHDGRH